MAGLVITAPLSAVSQVPSLEDPAAVVDGHTGVPVMLGNQDLFVIRDKSRFNSPEERAQRISQRVLRFAESTIPIDAVMAASIEGNTVIYADDLILLTVLQADAKAAGMSQPALSQDYVTRIRDGVEQYRQERSASFLFRAGLIALICTIALLLLLLLISKLTPYFFRWLDTQHHRFLPSIRIQNFELLSAEQLSELLLDFTSLLRTILVLAILYLYFTFVLNLFPQTRSVGANLVGYLRNLALTAWAAFANYLPNLLVLVLIVIVTHYLLRLCRRIFDGIGRRSFSIRGFYPEWAEPTYRLLSYLIIALAAVVAFPHLPGSGSPAFQGISIFLGALLSLGASGAVANTVSGFILVYTRAFQVGDRIKVGDVIGDVEEKLLLVTRIRTLTNSLVTIPNATLLATNITNYSALKRDTNTPLILSTTVTLGYDVPWRKIHQTLIEAALATPDILHDPSPFVLQTALNDFYVSYDLRAYTFNPEKALDIYSHLHQNIQDKCNAADIEICSPHYSALRDGNTTTIPANYLPLDYTPSGFRVNPVSTLLNGISGQNATQKPLPPKPASQKPSPGQNSPFDRPNSGKS